MARRLLLTNDDGGAEVLSHCRPTSCVAEESAPYSTSTRMTTEHATFTA